MINNPKNPLAERLRQARRARMTQQHLAAAVSWVPSKISKIESGRQLPSESDLRDWANATATGPDELRVWLDMLEQVKVRYAHWSEELKAGQAAVQQDYHQLVRSTAQFRTYQKSYVPLFLQTPDYTRNNMAYIKSVFQPQVDPDSPEAIADREQAVAARQASAALLFDPSRRFDFVLDEAVLRVWRYSPEVWNAQLGKIASVVGLTNVRLGIIAQDQFLRIFNDNSFNIYDQMVCVETFHADDRIIESDVVGIYQNRMDQLLDAAVQGPAALNLIEKARHALPV